MRYNLLKSKEVIVDNVIAPTYFDKYIKAPHCIMELSIRNWQCMRNNAIHVSDYMVNNVGKTKITRYNQVMYGDMVIRMKKDQRVMGRL